MPESTPVQPAGYYGYQPVDGKNPAHDAMLNNPKLAGLGLRVSLQAFNPSLGIYSLDYLSKEIQLCQSHGKRCHIALYGGVWTPAWMMGRGRAQVMQSDDARDTDGNTQMPLPWDDYYLDRYEEAIQRLAQQYDSNTAVVAFHHGGVMRSSNEFHLPNTTPGQPGYSPQKIIDAHKRILIAEVKAFSKPVILNVSRCITARDGIRESFCEWAAQKFPTRIRLQTDNLSAKSSREDASYALVQDYGLGQGGKPKINVGFEMLSASNQSRFGGSFKAAIAKGQAAGSLYYTIYHPDESQVH